MVKILVVIDAQNDFIDGALRNEEAIKRVPNIVNEIYYGDWDGIVVTQDTHYSHSYEWLEEGRRLPIPHCIKGTRGWDIQKDVLDTIRLKTENFIILEKENFGALDLPDAVWTIYEGIATDCTEDILVEFVGFCTDICVISNVMLFKASLRRGTIQVKESCCAGVTKESHETALKAMQACHIDIVD